eukprot:175439_1
MHVRCNLFFIIYTLLCLTSVSPTRFTDWWADVKAGRDTNTVILAEVPAQNLHRTIQFKVELGHVFGGTKIKIQMTKKKASDIYKFKIPQFAAKINGLIITPRNKLIERKRELELKKAIAELAPEETIELSGIPAKLTLLTAKLNALGGGAPLGEADFNWDDKDNEGHIEWVGANEYIMLNPETKTGIGGIIMNHIMQLYSKWTRANYKLDLEDAAMRFCDGKWWDDDQRYWFKELRAFEGYADDKPASFYGKWGFMPAPGEAVTDNAAIKTIRDLTKAQVQVLMGDLPDNAWTTLTGLITGEGITWNNGDKLGKAMMELNRANCLKYKQAIAILKKETTTIKGALRRLEVMWDMERKPAQVMKIPYFDNEYNFVYLELGFVWLLGVSMMVCCGFGCGFVVMYGGLAEYVQKLIK